MENILVPTDFSDNCNKAAKLAIDMAVIFNAEIHFLHQIKTPVDWVKLSKKNEERFPETKKEIGSAKTKLKELERKSEKNGLICRTFLEYVSDEDKIVKHSEHFHHDFIITGSKGTQAGFLNKILGSTAQRIIRKSIVPVLVVKQAEVNFPIKNIVFVSDFLEDIREAFSEVILIAEKLGAHIHLLNINTKSDFNSVENGLKPIETFVKQFPKFENYSSHIYNESTIIKGLEKFTETNEIDLIAICTHSRKGLLSIFSKSIAENLTNHSNLPVMTIHL
ncbi:universal stress protein [Lacinutrix iliipiscaria]|uniref:Universal stress protein n=1 Tax=Lacinutrix iliipiscaria TaxID=1230532 RepID=A0ABW5WLS9_9FLAO